jgi:hypothetical protein
MAAAILKRKLLSADILQHYLLGWLDGDIQANNTTDLLSANLFPVNDDSSAQSSTLTVDLKQTMATASTVQQHKFKSTEYIDRIDSGQPCLGDQVVTDYCTRWSLFVNTQCHDVPRSVGTTISDVSKNNDDDSSRHRHETRQTAESRLSSIHLSAMTCVASV